MSYNLISGFYLFPLLKWLLLQNVLHTTKKWRVEIWCYGNLILIVDDFTTKIRSLLLLKSAGVTKKPWRSGE